MLPILETAQVPAGFLLLLSATAHPQFDAAASAFNAPSSAALLVLLLALSLRVRLGERVWLIAHSVPPGKPLSG